MTENKDVEIENTENKISVIEFLEKHPTYRLLLMVSAIVGVVAFTTDISLRFFVERPLRIQNELNDTWNSIFNSRLSKTGRQKAFDRLIQYKYDFTSVDFSEINLKAIKIEGADFDRANFKDAWMHRFECIRCSFRKSYIATTITNDTNFSFSDMTNSVIYVDTDIKFLETNLSSSFIRGVYRNLENNIKLDDAWAWADQEPIITHVEFSPVYFTDKASIKTKDLFAFTGKLCDTYLRQNYEAKKQFGIPEGC